MEAIDLINKIDAYIASLPQKYAYVITWEKRGDEMHYSCGTMDGIFSVTGLDYEITAWVWLKDDFADHKMAIDTLCRAVDISGQIDDLIHSIADERDEFRGS